MIFFWQNFYLKPYKDSLLIKSYFFLALKDSLLHVANPFTKVRYPEIIEIYSIVFFKLPIHGIRLD